jgi:uncharacterized protein Usg
MMCLSPLDQEWNAQSPDPRTWRPLLGLSPFKIIHRKGKGISRHRLLQGFMRTCIHLIPSLPLIDSSIAWWKKHNSPRHRTRFAHLSCIALSIHSQIWNRFRWYLSSATRCFLPSTIHVLIQSHASFLGIILGRLRLSCPRSNGRCSWILIDRSLLMQDVLHHGCACHRPGVRGFLCLEDGRQSSLSSTWR